jgi:hypothetical protein
MYKIKYFFFLLIVTFLGSCSDLKKGLGVEKDAPNEFLIEKREPLSLPPDYKMLPPDSNINKNQSSTQTSLKSIIDTNLNNNKNITTQQKSTDIEKNILNQIK